ncbi:MAG: glucoamylase family protein [Niabella sp.]
MKYVLLKISVFLTIAAFSQTNSASLTTGQYGDGPDSIAPVGVKKGLADEQLMETVQKQTFRFFWHGAHPHSGLALERSNTVLAEHYWDYINEAWDQPNFSTTEFGPDAGAIGGTGFGIMATIVAVNRGWIGRDTAVRRLIQIADFLANADCFHGIYPHFMNARTGKTIKFDRIDDAADIVETSYLLMGFLCAREFFNKNIPREEYLRMRITKMWNAANWRWHTNGEHKLYWHWSPNNGFDMNFPVWGWNECLITYIMAASSPWPHKAIDKSAYDGTWAGSNSFKNGKTYYGYLLPLGNYDEDKGGPLFFEQYTFQGIDPTGLTDTLQIDYFLQAKNHTLINRAYCIENPLKYKGYSEKVWGLTAGDSYIGYVAHSTHPQNDKGVIQPTAAISSMPFTPKESMEAMRYFYEVLGSKIWGKYGFIDGFSIHHNWYAKSYIAIDEGPIINMIENYRTGLLWKLFMQIPDIQQGLKKLGFNSPYFKKKDN